MEYIDDRNIGKGWLFALGTMFMCLIFMFIILPVINTHLRVALLDPDSAMKGLDPAIVTVISHNYDFLIFAMRLVIYFTFFVSVVYMIFTVWHKEPTGYG